MIENLRLFLVIAEKGSLVGAAREMGMSSTTVSERLAALEHHYGTVLFHRTTRSLSLSEEGRVLIDGAKRVLAEVDDLEGRIRHGAGALSGPIRISAPIDLGRLVVCDVVSAFTEAHPKVSVELSLSDGYVDIVGQGFDIALRYGEIADSTLRQRRLGAFRRIVCAAPAYVARYGALQKPTDLVQHNCLLMRLGTTLDNVWHFGGATASQFVTVSGDKTVNDGEMVKKWAVAGQGIVMKSELDVGEELQSGQLLRLLEEYDAPPIDLQMMFPPGRLRTRRVQSLADALTEAIQGKVAELGLDL